MIRNLKLIFVTVGITPAFASTILNDDFDDNTVTGWQSVGNGLAANHSFTESGSDLTSQVVATQPNNNTHRGIVSDASFDPANSGGFTASFVVTSQGVPAPGANGLFLGLTSDNGTFFRDASVSSFGLTLFGHPTRTLSEGGVSLVTNDIGAGGSAAEGLILGANPSSIQLASLQDGFNANFSADASGWSYLIDGVNDLGGASTTISESGTWADEGTDFATVFGGDSDWHALASNQGGATNNTHTLVIDRITVTAVPEPSSSLLGALGICLAAARRRRQ